jgi:hypothetical protein
MQVLLSYFACYLKSHWPKKVENVILYKVTFYALYQPLCVGFSHCPLHAIFNQNNIYFSLYKNEMLQRFVEFIICYKAKPLLFYRVQISINFKTRVVVPATLDSISVNAHFTRFMCKLETVKTNALKIVLIIVNINKDENKSLIIYIFLCIKMKCCNDLLNLLFATKLNLCYFTGFKYL